MMNSDDLRELREIFRARFREQDFCIGEAQVEEVFRELLGEPEPEAPIRDENHVPSALTSQVVQAEMERMIPKLQTVFERHDSFYSSIVRKK